MNLMDVLKLPLNGRSQQRAAAHADWMEARQKPLELHDVIAD